MKSAVNTSDTLGLMLRDLDQFPMPDHEQQVELAKRVVAPRITLLCRQK